MVTMLVFIGDAPEMGDVLPYRFVVFRDFHAMPKLLKAIHKKDLAQGESTLVEGGPEPIALFNIDGTFYACSNACPHAGAPLVQGFTQGTTLVCPWHGWSFDLDAGTDAPKDGVIRYPIQIKEDTVYIEVPD